MQGRLSRSLLNGAILWQKAITKGQSQRCGQIAGNDCLRRYQSNDAKKTALYQLHLNSGGKMVEYGGYQMPVNYAQLSLTDSHLHTRSNCSIFDVSHMLQTKMNGKHAQELLESISCADLAVLKPGECTLTVYTNANGGILDDLIITRIAEDEFIIVSNAACRAKDQQLINDAVRRFASDNKQVHVHYLDGEYSLIALQGPKAAKCLQKFVDYDLSDQYFMRSRVTELAGTPARVTRCGYTGEDGFEISIPDHKTAEITQMLLDNGDVSVKLAGLGARDSLRVEASLCLYGNEMNDATTPVESGLSWLIPKSRRTLSTDRPQFPGAEHIIQQLNDSSKVTKRRIGLRSVKEPSAKTNGPAARSNAVITLPGNDQKIGAVTSGLPSPTLKSNIAMAFVQPGKVKNGDQVDCYIGKRAFKYEVVKMPFVAGKYHLPQKK